MARIVIRNAKIVNEGKVFPGSVIIENEVIAEILSANEEVSFQHSDEIIDAEFNYLIPGIIDDHVHFREPGLTHKADIYSETKAAVAGGVTSFMDMPNVIPQTTSLETLEEKFKLAADKSLVNYSFYFGVTNDNTELLPKLDKNRVCGVKLFMGSSTGNMLVDKADTLKRIFNGTDLLIAAHCEDQGIIDQNTETIRDLYGEDPDIQYHPVIRNIAACYTSSSFAIRLAKETGARLHILHVTTAKELELFEDIPLQHKKITSEVCIPHLSFTNTDYERLGAKIKCNPAIKGSRNKKALRKALSSDLIDVIGTDHAPHLLTEKQGGALKAVSGMPMIQFSLVTMMEMVKDGVLSIEQMVQKMCHAPAKLFGIHQRGFIRKGYKADLVLINPNSEWTVNNDTILSKCGWSPLEGNTFTSRVEKTFVNGTLVFDKGNINEHYRGQELRFR